MGKNAVITTELHRHLDVSVRTSTLLTLARSHGLEAESTSLEAFGRKILLKLPLSDLNSVLAKFRLFQQVLDRPEILERLAFEAVEDCFNEGILRVELRFSPSFLCELSGLDWNEALSAFERGRDEALKKYPAILTGFICIASRNYGIDSANKTVEFFLANRDRFIGLDLAGNERDFPCRLFEKTFKPARDIGAKITIHAGEDSGPENIWQAIELLGARRIGHGITAVKDPKLIDYLAKNRICLEMCPTSNWITRVVTDLSKHPIKAALRAGVPVCVNTDDPGIFGITLPYERDICRQEIGLSEEDLNLCDSYAADSSFL